MNHVLYYLLSLSRWAPLLGDKPGPRRSANSASREAGSVGAGYGVPNPMSSLAQPVPHAACAVASSPARGIVTRMGQDPQGLGGEAIEPGPAGTRPLSESAAAAPSAPLSVSPAPSAPVSCSANAQAWRAVADFLATGVRSASVCPASCAGCGPACVGAPASCKRSADAGAPRIDAPPSNTGVNKVSIVGNGDEHQ